LAAVVQFRRLRKYFLETIAEIGFFDPSVVIQAGREFLPRHVHYHVREDMGKILTACGFLKRTCPHPYPVSEDSIFLKQGLLLEKTVFNVRAMFEIIVLKRGQLV
jgi:hypothetical protein